MEIDADGVWLFNRKGYPFRYNWPHQDSDFTVTMMRGFFPAASAVLPSTEIAPALFGNQTIKSQAMAMFGASLEFRAIMASAEENRQDWPERFGAIELMEENCRARLAMMRNDIHRWQKLDPRGPLIDRPLLCIWVGIFRFSPRMAEATAQPRNEAGAFIRWLARELNAT